MISPRATRLVRVRDSRGVRTALIELLSSGDPLRVRDCLVVLPTRAAASHLRRALEDHHLSSGAALLLPDMVTRSGLTSALARRLAAGPTEMADIDRDVLLGAACRSAVAQGVLPPFRLRAGLVASMLEFYDGLRRLGHSVDSFERLTAESLEGEADVDRGAERLLRQTRFLATAFRAFEAALASTRLADEHGLRQAVLDCPAERPWRRVVVACRDIGASSLGLWPADFDLLTRIPGLEQLDVVVTETALAGELHERLHRWLPGIEEVPGPLSPPAEAELDGGVRLSRDREEEVRDYARRVKVTARSAAPVPLERMALVVRRPLPYVYLAREILRSAGVPCQLHDALPLAAEPFAAGLDLVSTAVASDWSRQALTALLSSPVFRFDGATDGRTLAAFDRALHEAGFLGGAPALESLVPQWEADPRRARLAGAGRLATSVMQELAPLASEQPAAAHLKLVRGFLERHAREQVDEELASRYARARAAVLNGLAALGAAFARYDTRPLAFADVDAVVKHWVERHTFAPRNGEAGLHVVDAESALTGDFDDVQIAGLVEGEWPQRPVAGIFYSTGLLRELGWPSDADRVAGERTLLADLLTLARQRTVVSGFRLEDDALVSVSPFAELLPGAGTELPQPTALPQVCLDEALMTAEPQVPDGSVIRQAWVDLRLLRAGRVPSVPEVTLRPYSVSALDRYQDCPFKFFAAEVLRIEEPPEDQSALTPRVQGTLLHDVLRQFFEEWDRTGRGLSPSAVAEARRHLAAVVDAALEHLPPADVALERARFFGSPVAPGIVDVLLRLEASRTEPVERRWLEQPLEGAFSLGGVGRQVLLRGKVDRVDMLAGRRLRVIDYKSGAVTQAKRSLQAPVYALLTAERLAEEDGEPWSIEEASYVAFAGKRTVASAIKPGSADRTAVLADARERTFEILDGVAAGAFPVRPHDLVTCRYCSYASVCRKDYVGDE